MKRKGIGVAESTTPEEAMYTSAAGHSVRNLSRSITTVAHRWFTSLKPVRKRLVLEWKGACE
eukprot:9707298-Prorocentrum_lima.AAC.1